METVEHFAKISLVAPARTREPDFARGSDAAAGVARHLRDRGPAPICADPASFSGADARDREDPATCQVVGAGGSGLRLVPGLLDGGIQQDPRPDGEAEIRLTYRELSALIEDAIRSLR
jgi:hypothetical protein